MDNKMDLGETGWDIMNWIDVAEKALVNTVVNIRFP
jgi:hypothetical protein